MTEDWPCDFEHIPVKCRHGRHTWDYMESKYFKSESCRTCLGCNRFEYIWITVDNGKLKIRVEEKGDVEWV